MKKKLIEGVTLYDVPKVAKILGITERTVFASVKRGDIKSVRIGRRVWITREAVKDFVTGKTTQETKDETKDDSET